MGEEEPCSLAGGQLRLQLTWSRCLQEQVARLPRSRLSTQGPLVSRAGASSPLPAASAAASKEHGAFRAGSFSPRVVVPRGHSWARPEPRSSAEVGSWLWPLGAALKASRTRGSSTCTVTSSRNLEKGSLASRRRPRRAMGPEAAVPPRQGGLRAESRPGDRWGPARPDRGAQRGGHAWSPQAWLGLALGLQPRAVALPGVSAWDSAGELEPALLGPEGFGPQAWEPAPAGILLGQTKVMSL